MSPLLHFRLILLYFLEFAVWGSYLVSFGNYLSQVGLGKEIFWFYTIPGLLTVIMPTFMGLLADRILAAQRLYSFCHLISSLSKMGAVGYCLFSPGIDFLPLFILFSIGVAFFMPTISLTNSITFTILSQNNLPTYKYFPKIRIFGTLGFICSMLLVNFIRLDGIQLQASPLQLLLSASISAILFIYGFTLPECPTKISGVNLFKKSGWKAFRILKDNSVTTFLIFSFLIGICLQITNSYANPFISFFQNIPEFSKTWGAKNANALISLSQISETLFILVIPFVYRKLGIKNVLIVSSIAWGLRYFMFSVGNTGDGIIFLIISMVVYGVAFDFFNIAGSIFIDEKVGENLRNSAQGLFMLVTGGLGASLGTPLAGLVVNHFVFSCEDFNMRMQGWYTSWGIFAAYSVIIGILCLLFFPRTSKQSSKV